MPRSKNRKSAKKKQPSTRTYSIQRSSEEPFFDTREEIRAFVRDMRSGSEITELRAALRIWEGVPWYVFLIQHEDAEIRQRTGTHEPIDMYDPSLKKIGKMLQPYEGVVAYCSAQQELLDAQNIASASLVRIASSRGIDGGPIEAASDLCRKVLRKGLLNDLPIEETRWPECADLLDFSDSERKEITFGQARVERIREEVFFRNTAPKVTDPPPYPFAEPPAAPTGDKPGLRPTWDMRKQTVLQMINELGKSKDGHHAGVKTIIKRLKVCRKGQREDTTRKILRELKMEGAYLNSMI